MRYLSTDIFNKVLKLPIDFFERTPTGEITRDIYEIWRIRNFLSGQALTAMLDSPVILVILPILFFFSALLTAVVLAICALILLWLFIMLPITKRKAGAVFAAEGVKSAYLVETVHARGQIARPRRPPPPAMGTSLSPQAAGSAVSARASDQPRANRHAAARAADDQRRVRARRLSRNFDPKPSLCRRPRRVHHC